MFDFEGGPCLSIGGDVHFGKIKWKIKNITPIDTKVENLVECVVDVTPNY